VAAAASRGAAAEPELATLLWDAALAPLEAPVGAAASAPLAPPHAQLLALLANTLPAAPRRALLERVARAACDLAERRAEAPGGARAALGALCSAWALVKYLVRPQAARAR